MHMICVFIGGFVCVKKERVGKCTHVICLLCVGSKNMGWSTSCAIEVCPNTLS